MSIEPTMDDVLERARQYQNLTMKKSQAHYQAAELYAQRYVRLGAPVTILTSIVATSVFASLAQNGKNTIIVIATGTLSIVAAVLSGLQTFLRYADVAAGHRNAGAAYESARRQLDIFALEFRASTDRAGAIKDLARIAGNLDSMTATEPTVPEKIYRAVKWNAASVADFSVVQASTCSTSEAARD